MSSCGDDDFGLLGDESQPHPPPHLQHHHHQHQQQPPAASVPFITHRYVSPSSKGSTSLPAVTNNHQYQSSHHQHRLHHQHLQHHHARPSRQHHSLKEDLISEKGTGEEVVDDIRREEEDAEDDDEGNYAGAFVHHREDEDGQALTLPPPKTLSAVASSFHRDVDCCFRDNASNPFGQSPPGDEVAENNDDDRRNGEAVEQKPCGPGAVGGAILPITTHSNNNTKRRDRDELSDDGASPFCYATTATATTPGAGGSKKSRPSALISPSPPPVTISGDYRKDREEWSDSAIGCLLDAYTDKYIQLNRGNLRGRDWEEVATVVSERCDKQKSCKSVEQCKNKVDNLKKRYKAERQRISSGSLSISHWPWFKKMEQIVGSSSASTALSKPISDDDKSTTASVVIAASGGGLTIKQTKRYLGSTAGNVTLTGNLKMKSSTARWHRVVLKISGAIFAGSGPQNVEPKVTALIAREISIAVELGVQVAVVVGGRNFFCGETWVASTGIDRATAYQLVVICMPIYTSLESYTKRDAEIQKRALSTIMMATMMNSVLLQASLEKIGVQTRVQTSFMMQEVSEPYVRRRAIRHLEKGRVVIFAGVGAGSGNPLFTTDTAAALRASEINADVVLKATSINSVYDCHSRANSSVSFEHISYRESLSRGFSYMDATAITFCEENNIPIVVFNLLEPGNISRALCGEQVGSLIDRSAAIS